MRETYSAQRQGGHADGHADPRHATTTAAWSSWSSRARSGRCARPTSGAAAHGPGGGRPEGDAAGARRTSTGTSGSGPAPERPYHPRYLPGCMTWEQLVGLRQRRAGRHGQPPDRPAVLGPGAARTRRRSRPKGRSRRARDLSRSG